MAELVDAPAWGAGDLGRGGSSPPNRTIKLNLEEKQRPVAF